MSYKYICPSCSKEVVYERRDSYTRVIKKKQTCRSCSVKLFSLVYNRLKPIEQDIVADYTINNMSVLAIAKKYEAGDRGTIQKILKENNIKIRKGHATRRVIKPYQGVEEISGSFWNRLKFSAKKRNIPLELTKEYVISVIHESEYICQLSGVKLHLDTLYENFYEKNLSIDRINSSIGYIEGNIQIVHKDINRIKWDLDDKSFYKLCKSVVFNNKYQFNDFKQIDNINSKFLNSIKSTAKRRDIEFNLSEKEMVDLFNEQKGVCSLTGEILILPKNYIEFETGYKTASLDRIDSHKSYTKENCRWIHKIVNRARLNFSDDVFKNWCYLVYNNLKDKHDFQPTFS